jgi:hypothetical protein
MAASKQILFYAVAVNYYVPVEGVYLIENTLLRKHRCCIGGAAQGAQI